MYKLSEFRCPVLLACWGASSNSGGGGLFRGPSHGQGRVAGWISGEGDIRMARLRRGQVHRSARSSRDQRVSIQAVMQRHCGEGLHHDALAQGREQVAHSVLEKKKSTGHNPRTCHKLRNLIEKIKGRRSGATKPLVVQWDQPACTRAGSAVLVPFKRIAVLPSSSLTCSTSCDLDSGGRQWVRNTYVRHDSTAGEQCQQVTPLGVAL